MCVCVCVCTSQGCPVDLSPRGPVALSGPQGIPVFLIMSEEIGLAKDRTHSFCALRWSFGCPHCTGPCGPGSPSPGAPTLIAWSPSPVPSSFLLGPLGPLPSLIGFCGAEFTGMLHSPVRWGPAAALPPPFLANSGASLLRGGPPSQPPPAHAAVCLLPQTMLEACCP